MTDENDVENCTKCGKKGETKIEDNGYKWAVCSNDNCRVLSYAREEVDN